MSYFYIILLRLVFWRGTPIKQSCQFLTAQQRWRYYSKIRNWLLRRLWYITDWWEKSRHRNVRQFKDHTQPYASTFVSRDYQEPCWCYPKSISIYFQKNCNLFAWPWLFYVTIYRRDCSELDEVLIWKDKNVLFGLLLRIAIYGPQKYVPYHQGKWLIIIIYSIFNSSINFIT